jgi:predicted exporter
LLAFRSIVPLWQALLVVATGIIVALSTSLFVFGSVHVIALLLGTSLIGVSLDYCLQYFCEVFAVDPGPPEARLKRVFMGILLGATTSLVGYITFLLAPLPGLHQIAVFSAVGLAATWISVVLWLPILDRGRAVPARRFGLSWLEPALRFWETSPRSYARIAAVVLAISASAAGLWRISADDDIRRLQSLSGDLRAEQAEIERLIGSTNSGQFFVVQAEDTERALEREETLAPRLRALMDEKAVGGFISVSQFVPSIARQTENRELAARLFKDENADSYLRTLRAEAPKEDGKFLAVNDLVGPEKPLSFLSPLVLDSASNGVAHVVSLNGVANVGALRALADDSNGVRFVDPVADYSSLLGHYRVRALLLLAISVALVFPLLLWRYGLKGAVLVVVPSLLAVLLSPALRALWGATFNFFDAMALVLIFAIGVDYAVFCAETSGARRTVTMFAVLLAAGAAAMSFGLLALSAVQAVHAFGSTMILGIVISFLFSPMARWGIHERALPRT